jgi:hypothetical protein
MEKVYIKQTNFSLELETGTDLSAATAPAILARRPNGSLKTLSAVILGTLLVHELADGDIDRVGTWSFQASFMIGSKKFLGQVVDLYFHKPLI